MSKEFCQKQRNRMINAVYNAAHKNEGKLVKLMKSKPDDKQLWYFDVTNRPEYALAIMRLLVDSFGIFSVDHGKNGKAILLLEEDAMATEQFHRMRAQQNQKTFLVVNWRRGFYFSSCGGYEYYDNLHGPFDGGIDWDSKPAQDIFTNPAPFERLANYQDLLDWKRAGIKGLRNSFPYAVSVVDPVSGEFAEQAHYWVSREVWQLVLETLERATEEGLAADWQTREAARAWENSNGNK